MAGHRNRGQPDDDTRAAVDDVVAVLDRWQRFGGTWRVTNRNAGQVTISLCRCDGGEEQERITSADPAVMAWLDGRTRERH
jgi:hypothetical protein